MRRSWLFILLLWSAIWSLEHAQELKLPNKSDSLRFAAIGDSGTGSREQYEVGQTMARFRQRFPFELVVMLGDNMYGSQRPRDYERKFEQPYKALLDAGVKFYAALGNHDNPNQRYYKLFNMDGKQYYTFKASKQSVRFFVLDTDYVDKPQLEWIEKELKNAGEDWKICYFHHPLYSSGARHGSSVQLRQVLEPIFVKYGVDVVLSGHDHFYERIKPQRGIYYFVSGAAGQLRRGNIRDTALTADGFDQDRSFMLMEISGDDLYFQTISRVGQTVDSGVIHQPSQRSTGSEGDPAGAGIKER